MPRYNGIIKFMKRHTGQGCIWDGNIKTWHFRISSKHDKILAGDRVLFNAEPDSPLARRVRADNRPPADLFKVDFNTKTYTKLKGKKYEEHIISTSVNILVTNSDEGIGD